MQNVANMKRLRKYEGIQFKPKSIAIVVDGSAYPVAEKMEDYTKWMTMTGHKFSDFTEPLSESYLHGKVDDVEDVKKDFEEATIKALAEYLQKAMDVDLKTAVETLKKIEQAPVAYLLKHGKMDEVNSLIKDLVHDWIRTEIVVALVPLDVAKGVAKVHADVQERVSSFGAMIDKMSNLKDIIQEKYKAELTEQNFKNFEDNLSVIRSQANLATLRGHENIKLNGKNLYELHLKSYTLDEIFDILVRD